MTKKLALLAILALVAAFDYSAVGAGSLVLTDLETSISPLQTIFAGKDIVVTADGLKWAPSEAVNDTDDARNLIR